MQTTLSPDAGDAPTTLIIPKDAGTKDATLSDGTVPNDWGPPVWIRDSDVWLTAVTGPNTGFTFDRVMRFTRASLGAPTIPAH